MRNFKVKFVDWGKSYERQKQEIDTAIQDCLINGQLILRDEVEKFEKKLAKYCRTEYAVGVSSGTSALKLSLMALGIGL